MNARGTKVINAKDELEMMRLGQLLQTRSYDSKT